MNTIRASAILLFLLACVSHAGDAGFNPDDLEATVIQLPDGSKVRVIKHLEHEWREVDAKMALSGADDRGDSVCFSGKFDTTEAPDKIKLTEIPDVKLTVIEPAKFKLAEKLKRFDNVWFCGTLRRNGKKIDFFVADLAALPSDAESFKHRIEVLEKKGDPEALIELGKRIDEILRKNADTFADFNTLATLKDRAFDMALPLKEKRIRADDADGWYDLGCQWRDLRRKNSKFKECLLKALRIDPAHPNASRAAREQLGMDKFEDQWLSKDEIERILNDRHEAELRRLAAQKDLDAAKAKARIEAESHRSEYLAAYLHKMRTNTPADRDSALTELGKAIEKSPDPVFAMAGIDILVNMSDPLAVSGLNDAARSEYAEVRRNAYEALVWRGMQQYPIALEVLAGRLKTEKDVPTAKSAVEALINAGSQPAIGTLIASVETTETPVQEEIIEGLKTATKQSFTSSKEWKDWWAKNKN